MPKVIDNTLDVYPEVKGIQVMNDMGDYVQHMSWRIFRTRRAQAINYQTLRTGSPTVTVALWGVTRAKNTFYSGQEN